MNQRSQKGRFSFSKEERISEKKIIDTLFNNGKKFNESPFDIRFLNQEIKDDSFSRVLITVSSSRIKSAVKRNLLKRRIKESYRKNKKIISNKSLMIAFVYVSDEILIYSDINDSVIKILKKLSKV
jgi:ribonuclease P protein component|tara:strand:+ start:3801 stop:4178 length:378 start_codon:yes stop_codon:yes gene_type:complete